MTISDLRKIGSTLVKELSAHRSMKDRGNVLGVGAGGDTFFSVDKRAEEIIFSLFEDTKDPLTLISEEAGEVELRGGGTRVIIDPIDGSKNAVSGVPLYSTSIAVSDSDVLSGVSMAYVVNLVTADEFWAEKGGGAYFNGELCRTQTGADLALTLYESQAPGKDIRRILPLLSRSFKNRCLGSTALDLALVASGTASIFVSPSPSRSFDFAGGWLLLMEAGGKVTDFAGGDIAAAPLDLRRHTSLLAAANPKMHGKALLLLNQPGTDV